jgi:cbb3-type cytochrome oxidase subunit 3
MLAMMVVFLSVVAFVFRRSSRTQYDHAARIPLDDDLKG